MTDTPRYGHAPIHMRKVGGLEDIDNAGDFAWRDVDHVRHIIMALPKPSGESPDNYAVIDIPVISGANISGKAWGWDGNTESPTLFPSVHTVGVWHGWIRGGVMVEA